VVAEAAELAVFAEPIEIDGKRNALMSNAKRRRDRPKIYLSYILT
jgi:hypothetical protein